MFAELACRVIMEAVMAFIRQILGIVEDIGINRHEAPSIPVTISAMEDWSEGFIPEHVILAASSQTLSLTRMFYRKNGFLWSVLRFSVLFLLISATWTGTQASDLVQPEGSINSPNETHAINATTPENLSQTALTPALDPFMGGRPFELGKVAGPRPGWMSGHENISMKNVSNHTQFNNSSVIDNESIQATLLKLPLSFIENRGQSSDNVKFMVKNSRETVFFTPSEVVFTLSRGNNSSVVHMAFEGSKPGKVTGEGLLPGSANFFIGNDSSKWVTEIPTYSSVRYNYIYPRVDLIFEGTEAQLKHELVLGPGADPSEIVISYSGQDNLSLAKDGSILIRTATGNITDSAPFCYQEINGTRVTIEGRYRLIDRHRIGFSIDSYNKGYPLVIDPTLKYSTYLGGSDIDAGNGIAVDGSGNAYITGYTYSVHFPTQNQYQNNADYSDAFVTKLSPAGNTLVYSTYLGGNGQDYGNGIAVDGSGNAYITGSTSSTDFPKQNQYQSTNAGYSDAFVTKLSPAGNTLVYSTYLGGTDNDNGYGIAVDGSGDAYITGSTSSSTDFPTQNQYQSKNAGGLNDAFVTKLSPAGNTLVYSTYLGDIGNDWGQGIAVDSGGNAYVTGSTDSVHFPTKNQYQLYQGTSGKSDAFVTKLSPNGNTLVYSTYLGGNNVDVGNGIAVDGNGNAYVTGITQSSDFPKQNPYHNTLEDQDAFVTKLSPGGNTLVYSTYLGGSGSDGCNGIAVDGSGSAYVTGFTTSTDFPTQNPYQLYPGTYVGYSFQDAFITKLSPGGNTLVYSTYLGGTDIDSGNGIAVDSSGNAYVTGSTHSTDFPTQNPFQGTYGGSSDAFVAVVSYSIPIALQAYNGQFLSAEGGGGGAIVANRNAINGWETFGLIDRGNGYVALRAYNGQYVSAEVGGGDAVVANRNAINGWETFKLIDRGNGNYALQAYNGQYVSAEGGGGDGVVANRNAINAWETFRFLDLRRPANVALQAFHGQFLSAEGGGGGAVVANRNAINGWETFGFIDRGNGYVALRAYNGQYVSAEGGGGGAVVANRNAINGWETFGLIYRGNGYVALRAYNGQYVSAEGGGGGAVVANRNAINGWETFKLIPR